MHTILKTLAAAIVIATLAIASSMAASSTSFQVKVTGSDFDSAVFSLESAIVDRGLVIDATGHVGAMLTRTGKVTGTGSPYTKARYLGFCSARLSAEAMQADPDNLAICPYVMFVYELKSDPGKARIGYRRPSGSTKPSSQKAIAAIEKLLADILNEATQ